MHANSFGAVADVYERGRPLYPPEAIDWLVPAQATRVADVGAGTGQLTRPLRERGLDVIAVEPSAGMREQLRRAVPGVPCSAAPGSRSAGRSQRGRGARLAGNDEIALHMVTRCSRADLPG